MIKKQFVLIISLLCAVDIGILYGLQLPVEIQGQRSFVPFDLGFSEKEKSILQSLKIKGTQDYNNFGHLQNLETEIASFLQSIGNDVMLAQEAASIVSAMVSRALQRLQSPTAWVTMRAFQPNTFFNTPRWHMDGYYYQPRNGQQYKIACALKGPGTLFCNVTDDIRHEFITIDRADQSTADNSLIVRERLAKLLEQYVVDQAQATEGMLFVVGDIDSAAVHSEPQINEDRLFISILPGTHEQIQELYNRWH